MKITQEIDLHLQYHQANSKKNTINTLYKPFLVKEFWVFFIGSLDVIF